MGVTLLLESTQETRQRALVVRVKTPRAGTGSAEGPKVGKAVGG